VDSFYPSETSDREKVRVTRDEKTGNVVEVMKKIRLGDLNIFSPQRSADWRVSVNLENSGEPSVLCDVRFTDLSTILVSHPVGSATHTRRKDRLSYSHEEFVIDLTQVTSNSGGSVCISLRLSTVSF